MASVPEREAHRLRNGIVWTVALAVLLLAIGLAVPDLRDVLVRAAHADLGWLALAVALELLSCLGYVAVVRLVLRGGPAGPVRSLAWAELAFGAVVPVGGAGGLAVGAWAMRAWGSAWSRIANRSAVIFLLTSGVNALVLALSGLGVMLGVGAAGKGVVYGLLPAVAGVGGIAVFALLPVLAARIPAGRRSGRLSLVVVRTGSWVKDTEAAAKQGDWRLLGTFAYLLFDIAVLWACLRAVGTNPPLMALVVGYQIGYLANLVPIPGAVGVLEGGLLGALLLYGLPAGPTAAAVVIYHAIALWVPATGGTVGFARLRGAVSERGAMREQARAADRTAPAEERRPADRGVPGDQGTPATRIPPQAQTENLAA
jgi:uncharacterized membrane protein YbhN (UPF0104 family)